MSDFLVCYNWMMDNEDRLRLCKIVPDSVSPKLDASMTEEQKQAEIDRANNAKAVSGCNSYYHPDAFAKIIAVPSSQREPLVQQFYKEQFWNRWYESLDSDEVGKRVFDEGVNAGPGTAVQILQQAVNASITPSAPRIAVDGKWGPQTISAVNSLVEGYLVIEFKRLRLAHYQNIVLKYPQKAVYLGTADHPGPWWIRAIQ